MSRRGPNPAEERAARNQQTIKTLLKLDGNKSCADCKRNKHPRWASWNLGIFVCIRCSGIHRGMGTHISRVKSVDLDAWTDEQLQSVLRWGNARANKYWEAKLAPGHVPSEAKIENFIRTKYESKRWVMEGPMPDPSTLDAEGDDDVPLNIVQEKAKLERNSSQRAVSATQPPAPTRRPVENVDLMGGDDMPSPPVRPSTTDNNTSLRAPPARDPTHSQLLGGLDFFGGPPERPASASSKPVASMGPSRPDLKQSILSLYATAPRSQSQPQPQPQQSQLQHSRQPSMGMRSSSVTKPSAFGGLDDAFAGLEFGGPSSPPVSSPQPQQQPKPSPFSGFGQMAAQQPKATPAAPQITSTPLSGGSFFDTGPKPPPKQAAPQNKAPPPQALRKISNASDGFGEFSSAMNPPTASSIATSSNGLLDLSSPPVISSARPANPSSNISSIFNLSAPAPSAPANYKSVTQNSAPSTAPATKSTFPNFVSNDLWGASDPWAAPDQPSAPPTGSMKSSVAASPAVGDFGWGNTPAASAGLGPSGSGGFNLASPAATNTGGFNLASSPSNTGFTSTSGFGNQTAPAPPKIAPEEDFGGWNSAAPETPAAATATAATGKLVVGNDGKPTFQAPASEDLWSNVWQ